VMYGPKTKTARSLVERAVVGKAVNYTQTLG
jgi:hypothetical protein